MQKLFSISAISLLNASLLFLFAVFSTQTNNFTLPSALAQSSSTCTNYYVPGVSIPQGYAPPWDIALSSGQMLVSVSCTSPTAGTLIVGRGNSADYVYKLAYLYQGNAWAPQTLTSSSALQSSNWYTAKASVSLPSSSLTSSWTYAVGYVCSWNGLSWKCGCADAACTQGYWQLQAYKVNQTSTTGGTTGTTGSPSGTTITPGNGSITDSQRNTWTVTSGGIIDKNGTAVPSSGVILGLYYNGSFYQENSGHVWYQWNGSDWTQISGDPRGSTTGQTTGNTTGASGGSIPCAVGPNASAIPAPAQAAGFTTCIFNSDFRQSYFTNLSNWLDCAGATNPIWYDNEYAPAAGPIGCDHFAVVADTDNGNTVQVLHQWVTVADANAGYSENSISTFSGGIGTRFPFAMYFEMRMKTPTDTVQNSCGSSWCGIYDIFKFPPQATTEPSFEMDMMESYAPNRGAGGGCGPALGGATANGWCPDTPIRNFNNDSSYVYDGYNTYGVLWTQDGNGTVSSCEFSNGNFRGCASGGGNGPSSALNFNDLMVETVGDVGASQQDGNGMTAQREAYTEYITVWGCANWKTTGCPGTVVTSAP